MNCQIEHVEELPVWNRSTSHRFLGLLLVLFTLAVPGGPTIRFYAWAFREVGASGIAEDRAGALQQAAKVVTGLAVLALQIALYMPVIALVLA